MGEAIVMTWTVTYLMHSTLLIVLAMTAARFLRSASLRDTLWKLALVGGIVTATLQVMVPVPLPEQAPQRVVVRADALPAMPVLATPATPVAKTTRVPLEGIYALVALALLTRIFLGRRRFLRLLGERTELVAGAERAMLDALAARIHCTRAIRLTQSERLASPVAMLGWEIVIPSRTFHALSAEQQETILAHELGHLVRRDPQWLTLAELVKALLFVQPVNWLIAPRMKETAELLCDDAAVLQTGNRRALAETLAELASHVAPSAPAVAAMHESGSNLIVRVRRVLSEQTRAPLHPGTRFAVALTAVAAMAVFAPAFAPALAVTRTRTKTITYENDFADVDLGQSFEGPDGHTRVQFTAHDVTMSSDGRSIRFKSPDAFIRADVRGSRGVHREIEVRPNPDLSPRYRYVVNGAEQAWCDDARRAMITGFLAEDAYDDPKLSTWNAHVERSDDHRQVLEVVINDLHYDAKSGAIDLSNDPLIRIVDTSAPQKRTYEMKGRHVQWHGVWDDGRESREQWLRRILRDETGADSGLVDAILQY